METEDYSVRLDFQTHLVKTFKEVDKVVMTNARVDCPLEESEIAENPRPSKTAPKESRPLRLVKKVEVNVPCFPARIQGLRLSIRAQSHHLFASIRPAFVQVGNLPGRSTQAFLHGHGLPAIPVAKGVVAR